jgi:pimeloyl-ACP methyl ester carboxylesterase
MSKDYDPTLEPDVEFYRVTDKDLSGQRGNLIKKEQLAQDAAAALDDACATYRVLYQSASGLGDEETKPTNEPVAVSGLIAFPSGEAPTEGWPVVSWAHGTVGSADKSAPSMDPYLEEVPPADEGLGLLRKINKAPHALLNAFLRAGWAVAMTDYEGLGTYGNHPYLLGVSEGRGILDIVPAVHQLATQTVGEQTISDRYAIVGHSQGGQAALWGAHLASTGAYPTTSTLIGVASLAPASNLRPGLQAAYSSPSPVGDLGAFYPLFCNGVFGGDPTIDMELIFQPDAVTQYLRDFNTKARVELSEEDFWMKRPPLAVPDPLWSTNRSAGIFRMQVGSEPQTAAWNKYWRQVDTFNPARKITVPIHISQAAGDTRVNPANTAILLEQLHAIDGIGPITEKFYVMGEVATPDPATLGEHFGLLVYELEIQAILDWFAGL